MLQQEPQKHESHLPTRPSALKFFSSGHTSKQPDPLEKQREWTSQYLAGLRAHQNSRPSGPKVLPNRTSTPDFHIRRDPYDRTSSALSFAPLADRSNENGLQKQPQERQRLAHQRSQSAITVSEQGSHRGRPLVLPPQIPGGRRDFSISSLASNTSRGPAYVERGSRWVEKQEARSLREALEDMDVQDELKVHQAAQDEASELVWKHKYPGSPFPNPDTRKDYKSHLEKGAHARSQSLQLAPQPPILDRNMKNLGKDAARLSLLDSSGGNAPGSIGHRMNKQGDEQEIGPNIHGNWDSPKKQAYISLAFQIPPIKQAGRRVSSGKRRTASGSVFSNPNDSIYEEPQEHVSNSDPAVGARKVPGPLKNTVHRPASRSKLPSFEIADKHEILGSHLSKAPGHNVDPITVVPAIDLPSEENFEGHVSVADLRMNTSQDNDNLPRMKDGLEIRSDDIRAATSKRFHDRSPKLPTPTVVSDRSARPIVSFDEDWPLKGVSVENTRPPSYPYADGTASAPIIPTITTTSTPSIKVDVTPSVPAINSPPDPIISVEEPSSQPIPSVRPLPQPRKLPFGRPKPAHSSTTPAHWTPIAHNARSGSALCAACALPISGRIVAASSQRFHPGCFSCHHCSELLECVAFYPEPDTNRDSRLANAASGQSATPEDADESPRFYCHLDFHELFSPRCRNCKTPIEGEVVVACGGEWHVGHFFCAECGDPFGPSDPFVEKSGYAWCVRCHQQRTASRCKGCKKPVLDGGVEALGGQWHEGCFRCMVSRQAYDSRYQGYTNFTLGVS